MVYVVGVVFGFTWWLGLYVIGREPGERRSRRAGLGILVYALALAVAALPGRPEALGRVETVLVCLPVVLWTGAALALVPGRERLERVWSWGLAPVSLVAIGWLAVSGGGDTAVKVLLLAPLAGALILLVLDRPARVWWLAAVATLFFGLGAALLFGPRDLTLLLAIDLDMALLGVAIAMSNAHRAGEALWADMARSLLGAVVVAMASGGQVALAMALGEPSFALVALLFGVIAVAVAVQTLAGPVHRLLDRVAFPGAPAMRRERAELRATSEALPRREEGPPPLDDTEFVRLTRRALANYGDLGKLASSPLANLPVIDKQVTGDSPLERASELKRLLLDSIQRLRPRDGEFGTSEEWRYYNVLFFPYVRGLRPYRRGASRDLLDPVERQAFDWFARHVPERTLYNWQNAAAKLVADDLRSENWQ
ncbi:hypothetical protein [Streptosporangium sp. KLBMP 9127]|nr:hypothetical protein [Streptosporangium sp. KLBMP 9127]